MGFAFDGFILDPKRRELRRGTELVRLEPQAFDLLTYLVRHRDRVIGRDELVDAIWGGRIVTDATLTTRINILRRAIADDGKTQRLIRTLSRRGIRFVAQVIEVTEDETPPSLPLQVSGASVALLSLLTSEGDLASKAFAGCLIEDIATILMRIPWLAVIAGSRAFPDPSAAVDLRNAGQRLGARYILAGSVRRNKQRLRVAVQLIDVESRAYLWAERIEGELSDRFELQDRAAAIVAGNIELALEGAESRRSVGQPLGNLALQELCRRALRACYAYEATALFEARELLDHALDRDPDNAPVLAVAAGCRQFLDCAGWADDDREMDQQSALDLAEKALQADSKNPTVLAEAARVLAYFTGDIETSILMIQRALLIDPSHVRSWYWNGWIRLFAGEPDLAAEHFQTSSRLNPTERPHLTGLGIAHFFSGRYQQAVTMLNASLYDRPRWPTTYRFLAAAYAHLGKLDAARSAVGRLQTVAPAPAAPINRFHNSPFQNRDHSARYLEGLSLAMESH